MNPLTKEKKTKKKTGKYLKFYYECMATGRLKLNDEARSYGGLCGSTLSDSKRLKLFRPEWPESNLTYWAAGHSETGVWDEFKFVHNFSTLRQTIVLFLAAMNNEL